MKITWKYYLKNACTHSMGMGESEVGEKSRKKIYAICQAPLSCLWHGNCWGGVDQHKLSTWFNSATQHNSSLSLTESGKRWHAAVIKKVTSAVRLLGLKTNPATCWVTLGQLLNLTTISFLPRRIIIRNNWDNTYNNP